MENNSIQKMALAIKLIAKHEKFASAVTDISVDKWFLRLVLKYDRAMVEKFKRSGKWECKVDNTGFISIERKVMGTNIYILLC